MAWKNVLAAIAVSGLASSALGAPYFDDLTDGVLDPFFDYDFGTASDFTGTSDSNGLSLGDGLWVYPDAVTITFPGLPVGELVELAHVEVADYVGIGSLDVEFFGTLGSLVLHNLATSTIESYQVDQSDGIGYITSIRIAGFEDAIKLVSLRTVPAPATAGLLALACLTGARRRR